MAQYLMLIAMSCIVFIWAWDLLASYFDHFFESTATLDDVVESLDELRSEIAIQGDETRSLEIVA